MKQIPNLEARASVHNDGVTPVESASSGKYAYYFLQREKRSRPWQAVAFCYVAGDSCQRAAEIHLAQHGYIEQRPGLDRIADQREWSQFQATYARGKK